MNCQSCGSEMPDGICEALGCVDGLYRQLPAIIDPDKPVEKGQLEGLFPVKSEHEPRYKFLSYRYQGFTLKESQKKSEVSIQQIQYWRRMDPQFRELELGLLGPNRNQIRKEIFGLAYLRNYALILEKDYTVLQKDAELGVETLTKEEEAYLRRIRQFYTPMQMQNMQQLIDGLGVKRGEETEEFANIIKRVTRKAEVTETVEYRNDAE